MVASLAWKYAVATPSVAAVTAKADTFILGLGCWEAVLAMLKKLALVAESESALLYRWLS